MDQNKLTKLKEIDYKINHCCSLCKHGNFPSDDWGTCRLHTYSHIKHSDKLRQLSIHKCGGCPQFEQNDQEIEALHGFKELL